LVAGLVGLIDGVTGTLTIGGQRGRERVDVGPLFSATFGNGAWTSLVGWLAHLLTQQNAPTHAATPRSGDDAGYIHSPSLALVSGGAGASAACRQFGTPARPGRGGVRALTAPFAEPRARTLGTALA
jgi:hypothetical protein